MFMSIQETQEIHFVFVNLTRLHRFTRFLKELDFCENKVHSDFYAHIIFKKISDKKEHYCKILMNVHTISKVDGIEFYSQALCSNSFIILL